METILVLILAILFGIFIAFRVIFIIMEMLENKTKDHIETEYEILRSKMPTVSGYKKVKGKRVLVFTEFSKN